MRFRQPEAFDFRWTVAVVSIGVVLMLMLILYVVFAGPEAIATR